MRNNQQTQQLNPTLDNIREKGRIKAEETIMRLKKQKEEQEELKKKAMKSIAAAASSAGITLPTTTPATTTSTKTANASPKSNNPATGKNYTLVLLYYSAPVASESATVFIYG